MSSFVCSILWFVFGVLVGWLLAWWLSRNCCKKPAGHDAKLPQDKAVKHTAPPSTKVQSFSAAPELLAKVAPKTDTKPTLKPATKPTVKAAPKTLGFNKAAALLTGIKVKGSDDLEVIEGIGPKISELLKADGIADLAALAKASQVTLQGILDKAGARYKLAKPATWPEQAKLADTGKWLELKTLQDSLSGGKR